MTTESVLHAVKRMVHQWLLTWEQVCNKRINDILFYRRYSNYCVVALVVCINTSIARKHHYRE